MMAKRHEQSYMLKQKQAAKQPSVASPSNASNYSSGFKPRTEGMVELRNDRLVRN